MVMDILIWVECYSTMTTILSAIHPDKAPPTSSRNFEGTAWASYDIIFRQQATNRRSLDWGIVDK